MNNLQMSRGDYRGFKGSRIHGFVSIPSNFSEGYGRKTTLDYIRMLYISYGSVCELET